MACHISNGFGIASTYYYVVSAVNDGGESADSSEASATPTAAPVPVKLTGATIGTPGSYNNEGNTIAKVFDGNLGTYFDAPGPDGNWAGLDLGSEQRITLVTYCPRPGWASRMVGGIFQGSNTANFSSGVVTLFTIGSAPPEGALTEQAISDPGSYRYVRYLSPDGSYGNVAELEFYTVEETTDTTPPALPSGLVAAAGNGSVALDWADNTEADFASYSIYRSTTGGSGHALIAAGLTSSNYHDDTVINGTTYFYVVTATDALSNESAFSLEVSSTPSSLLTLSLVNPGFEQPAAGKITDGFDGVTDVPGWNDYGAMADSGIEATSFTPHSGAYAAYLMAGDGGAYQMTGYTIQDGDVMTVGYWARIDWADSPCNITAGLFWDAPNSGANVIGSHTSPNLSGTWTYFEYSVTATAASVGHELGIEFMNSQTDWAALDDVTLTVTQGEPDTTPPTAPTGLVATAGDSSVDLDWADNGETDLASYLVYRSTTSGSGYELLVSDLVASAYTDNTTDNGTSYFYVVTASDDSSNESGTSDEASATPLSPAESWRFTHFGTTENSGQAADDFDADKDGISNLLERAFGGDPNESDPEILPKLDPEMPLLSILYRVNLDATDFAFDVQENTDLQGAWDAASGSGGIVETIGNIRIMRFTRPVAGEAALFLRVRVSGP